MCTVKTASPLMPVPPSSLRRFCWKSSGRLCGKRFADDVTLVPMDPFYRIRFDDGTWFDYSGDAEAHAGRSSTLLHPTMFQATCDFVEDAERCKTLGFEGLGSMAFDTLGDLIEAIPYLPQNGGMAQHLQPGGQTLSATTSCARS
jgi:hypothetical protein